MELTRNLKRGMSGDDVRKVKDKLFSLGYFGEAVKKITHDRFGADTEVAVRAFQRAKGLEEDGSWAKIHGEHCSLHSAH